MTSENPAISSLRPGKKLRLALPVAVAVIALLWFITNRREEAAEKRAQLAMEWVRTASAHMQEEEPDEAIGPFRRASMLVPRDPSIHARLGDALSRARRFSEAAAELQVATRLSPQTKEFRSRLAMVSAQGAETREQYNTAVARLETKLRESPQSAGTRPMLAGLHMRFIQWTAARQELERCAQEDPGRANVWLNLSTVCEKLGDPAAARAALARYDRLIAVEATVVKLQQRLNLDPSNAQIYLKLALALRSIGNVRSAFQALERAAQLDPQNPEIRTQYAAAQEYMRHMSAAQDSNPEQEPLQ